MKIEVEFGFGDKVILDGEETLHFRIVAIRLYPHGNLFLCAWFKPSGDYAEEWFDGWRLTRAG